MTSGRTIMFSAVIIVASSLPLLLFPQGFLKSITYAIIASVMLSAILSITVLAGALAILGPNVDALGVRTLLRIPFLRNWKLSNRSSTWFAEKTQKTKTREEVEKGFWGKLVNRVMKRPIAFAAPIVIVMILLIIPLGQLVARRHQREVPAAGQLGAPGTGGVRQDLPRLPHRATDDGDREATTANPSPMRRSPRCATRRWQIPGFIDADNDPSKMWQERPYLDGASKDPSVRVIQNGLEIRNDAPKKIEELRAIQPPRGLSVSVGGTPALEQDSIHSLFAKLPLMVVAADHHDDDPDVPGVRIGGVADQGRGDECAHARLHDGRADVDVRRRPRLRA